METRTLRSLSFGNGHVIDNKGKHVDVSFLGSPRLVKILGSYEGPEISNAAPQRADAYIMGDGIVFGLAMYKSVLYCKTI